MSKTRCKLDEFDVADERQHEIGFDRWEINNETMSYEEDVKGAAQQLATEKAEQIVNQLVLEQLDEEEAKDEYK